MVRIDLTIGVNMRRRYSKRSYSRKSNPQLSDSYRFERTPEQVWIDQYRSICPPPQPPKDTLDNQRSKLRAEFELSKQTIAAEMGLDRLLNRKYGDTAGPTIKVAASIIVFVIASTYLIYIDMPWVAALMFGYFITVVVVVFFSLALDSLGLVQSESDFDKQQSDLWTMVQNEIDRRIERELGPLSIPLSETHKELEKNWNDEFQRNLTAWRNDRQRQIESRYSPEGLRSVLSRVKPLEFEHFVADIYRLLGYRVEVSKASGDGGVDVIASSSSECLLIQAKHYQGTRIGVQIVRELYGVSMLQQNNSPGVRVVPLVITTFGVLTQEAAKFAEGASVQFIGFDGLMKLVSQTKLFDQSPRWNSF